MPASRRSGSKKDPDKNYVAAIDIGTNSFHLVIVEVLPNHKFKIIDREKENVRLGSGGKDMKTILPDAMERGIAALKRYAEIAKAYHARIRAVATSAVREALNQREFLKKVYAKTGIEIEVISGFEEARLIYLGVLQALPVFKQRILMIDIGGGSVEYLVGERGDSFYANSLKIGHIRLTQRYFNKGRLRESDVSECRDHVRGFISTIAREIHKAKFDVAVGSSGTILNVANMIRARQGMDITSQLNNFSFKKEELNDVAKTLLHAKTDAQRLKIPGLDPKRADVIVAGVIVLKESFERLGIKKMIVSEYALREGIIYDHLQSRVNRGSHHDHLSNIRYQSARHLAEQFHYDETHARHVTQLALSFFDQTRKLHKLSEREREFLELAGLLHEIGFFVSHDQHHRHSYYLIRNAELPGFTDHEKEIIANVARYHRKSHPKPKHEGFAALNPKDQKMVAKLAGILRVADGLDRTHLRKSGTIRCKVLPKKVVIRVRSRSNLDLEAWAVDMKKGLFEEVFKRKIVLKY